MEKPQAYTVTIVSKEQVGEHIYFVRFSLPEDKEIHFEAGQTVMFKVPSGVNPDSIGVNRSMSIASSPSKTQELLMCHDTKPMGPFSKWTIQSKIGDTIDIIGPLGIFTLDKESPRNKILIATGTGIAPFRSMLLDVFSNYALSTIHYELFLYWGLRHETDIYWNDEFTDLAKRFPNFHYYLTLSQPQPSWSGLKGRVTAHLDTIIDTNAEYYLCGSNDMIREVKEKLLDAHVPKEQIKHEAFFT